MGFPAAGARHVTGEERETAPLSTGQCSIPATDVDASAAISGTRRDANWSWNIAQSRSAASPSNMLFQSTPAPINSAYGPVCGSVRKEWATHRHAQPRDTVQGTVDQRRPQGE